jgi:hypothetical protein
VNAFTVANVLAGAVLSLLTLASVPQAPVPLVTASPSSSAETCQTSKVSEPLTDATTYVLSGDNWALHGCWEPCLCPLLIDGDMTGQFMMELTQQSPDLTSYAVTGVAWDVFDYETAAYLYTVTGSGTYEVRTLAEGGQTQRMILDLEYDEFASQFDSGEVPIEAGQPLTVLIAESEVECLKEAFLVQAAPIAPLHHVRAAASE